MGPTNLVDRVGRTAAQPLFALGVASMGMGAAALIVSWALPYAISCVVAGVWLLSILRSSTADGNVEPATDRRVLFREFWRFAAPRGLAGVFAVAVLWLDTLLLGALRSTEEAGVYAAATRFLVFGGFTSQAVIQAIAPTMSELITRRNLAAAASVYRTGTAWSIALGWPVYLTLAVFAPAILASFGAGYREAATALAIVAVAMLVGSGVGAIDVVLLMAGKSSWNLLNAAAAVAVNVALNLVLIPRMGMTGAAIAWAASIVTNNVAPLIQVRAHLGIDPLSRGTVSMAVAACVAFGVVGLLLRAAFGLHVGVLVAAVLAGLVIYVPLIWRLRRVLGLDLLVRSARRRGSMA
jgi:O-antigen/teichoic acid export membrane protein